MNANRALSARVLLTVVLAASDIVFTTILAAACVVIISGTAGPGLIMFSVVAFVFSISFLFFPALKGIYETLIPRTWMRFTVYALYLFLFVIAFSVARRILV